MSHTPPLKSIRSNRLIILWKKHRLSPAIPVVIGTPFLDPPPYTFNDELEIRHRAYNRSLHWIRIINALFTFSLAIAIVTYTSRVLREYSAEQNSSWFTKPWPANLDIRTVRTSLGCSIGILLANLIYIIAAFTPSVRITEIFKDLTALSAEIISLTLVLSKHCQGYTDLT